MPQLPADSHWQIVPAATGRQTIMLVDPSTPHSPYLWLPWHKNSPDVQVARPSSERSRSE